VVVGDGEKGGGFQATQAHGAEDEGTGNSGQAFFSEGQTLFFTFSIRW